MKMGIKEFRERISEMAVGDELIVLTHHGKRVGRYIPDGVMAAPDIDWDAWQEGMYEFGREWRARTPDWREQLRAMGEPEEDIQATEAEDRCS